jgi:hypothetical protein
MEFLDLTSVTLDEFQQLVPPFEAAFHARMAVWRMDGKPRTARRFTVYTNCPLPTPEDRLFFLLTYLKTSALQVVHGRLFGMVQGTANQWMHVLLPALLAALRTLGDAPARSLTALAQRLGVSEADAATVVAPLAIEECLALGLASMRGIVADSKAYSRRTLGLCLERGVGLVTLVPRTCAVRQDLEAWGQQQPALPLLIEKPGRTKDEAPRRWHGQSVLRQIEVEYSDGRIVHETLRFVVVHSSQLAEQQTQAYTAAQAKEAEAVGAHIKQVHARWFACEADAAAAIAEYEHRGPGRRGRRPQPWRYHAVRYHVVADTRPTRRARPGRPAKTDPPPTETGYRLVVELEALLNPEEDNGWTVLATTVHAEACTDAEILQAYQEQHITVEPGFRWIKNPAAISPVWLEKPERIASLAMLTVIGLLVYSIMQRQVRLYLHTHDQQIPGNKGPTATPTAAVVLALFAQVALVQFWIGEHEVAQVYGVQPHHLLICDALGLDHSWYEAPSVQKTDQFSQTP